jgi:hypothetical protein
VGWVAAVIVTQHSTVTKYEQKNSKITGSPSIRFYNTVSEEKTLLLHIGKTWSPAVLSSGPMLKKSTPKKSLLETSQKRKCQRVAQ